MKNLISKVFTTLIFLYGTLSATTYYVDQNDSIAIDTLPGTIDLPWKTIHKANQTLEPGDTIFIRGGIYLVGDPLGYPEASTERQGINPVNSGVAGNPITYSNYNGETVEFVGISDRCFAVNLDSDYGTVRSYIIVTGFTFTDFNAHLWIRKGDYNEISHCKFVGMRPSNSTNWRGSTVYRDAQYNHIHHCTFSDYGYFSPNDNNVVFELGNESPGANDNTSYNLIEHNEIARGGHHVFGMNGNHNVIRNNYIHNEEWSDYDGTDYSNRVTFMVGNDVFDERNLIEGNRIAYGGSCPDEEIGGSGGTIASRLNIIRKNMYYQNGIYASIFKSYSGQGTGNDNKFYNNVIWHNGHTTVENQKSYWWDEYSHGLMFADEATSSGNIIKNNIFYDNKNSTDATIPMIEFDGTAPDLQTLSNNWKGGIDGDPRFMDISGIPDPMDSSQFDFRLQPESSCIDSGASLTTIITPDSTGTQFQVEDAGYLMDGWDIIEGDEIQLEGSTQRARITDVNYETNEITVDKNLSWAEGQGISLAYEGDAPDIGAYEYVVGGVTPPPINLPTNYPNPFTITTTINYSVIQAGNIKLIIYDMLGREIKTLVDEYQTAGTKTVQWNGTDSKGKRVSSGTYFYQIKWKNGDASAKKMILIK